MLRFVDRAFHGGTCLAKFHMVALRSPEDLNLCAFPLKKESKPFSVRQVPSITRIIGHFKCLNNEFC